MELRRIVIATKPEILFLYVTRQVDEGLIWHDQKIQNPFIIIHNVQELSTEIHTRSFILFFLFVGYVNFERMKPQVFM
jgi:hypothetical protein